MNCLAPSVNSTEVEKPGSRMRHFTGAMAMLRLGGSRKGKNNDNEDNLKVSSRTLPDLDRKAE